jgi:hypothetical protein
MNRISKFFFGILTKIILAFAMIFSLSITAFAVAGDISDTIISNLTYDSSVGTGEDESMVKIADNYFALVYKSTSGGILTTFSISSDGETITEIDNYTFESDSDMDHPAIARVEGSNYYAIVYESSDNLGELVTVQISNTGTITKSKTDTEQFDTELAMYPKIIHANADYYAVTYTAAYSYGTIKTYSINGSGEIGNSATDTLVFDPNIESGFPNTVNLSGDYFGISYQGPGFKGFLVTITINSSGEISDSVIDSLEFANSIATSELNHISGNVYVIMYHERSADGDIVTVTIDGSGQIGNSVIDTMQFTSTGDVDLNPNAIMIGNNIMAIVYAQAATRYGYIRTFYIESNGTLPTDENDRIDQLIFYNSDTFYPKIMNVSGGVYAIAHRGSGKMTTISIGQTSVNVPEFGTITFVLVIIFGLGLFYFKNKKMRSLTS